MDILVAERLLDVRGASAGSAIVRVWQPQKVGAVGWRCKVQVTGLEDDSIYSAEGEDSLQALLLGLDMIRARLSGTPGRAAVTWLGQPDHGL